MRQFEVVIKEQKEITKVICNMCKKEIEVKNGMPEEEILSVEKQWEYYSNKDGEKHSFDICEECYDKLVTSFAIPVKIE